MKELTQKLVLLLPWSKNKKERRMPFLFYGQSFKELFFTLDFLHLVTFDRIIDFDVVEVFD